MASKEVKSLFETSQAQNLKFHKVSVFFGLLNK